MFGGSHRHFESLLVRGSLLTGRMNSPLEILSNTNLGMRNPYSFGIMVSSAVLISDSEQLFRLDLA
jgi:hypothetical protein